MQNSTSDDAKSGKVELDTFLGEWKDSMGNKVNVEWAKGHSSRGELDVWLTTRGNKHIQLGVRSQRGGNFACGHYNLDTDESRADYIVWVDVHDKKKTSIWKRPNDSSWDNRNGSGWDDRGSRSHDNRADWNKDKNWRKDDAWKQGRDKWNSRDDDSSWKDRDLKEGKAEKDDDLNALWNSDKKHDSFDDAERRSSDKGSWKRGDSRERRRDPFPGFISKAAPSKVPEPEFPPRTPQPKRMPGMSGGAGADGRGRRENDDLISQLAAGFAAPASGSDMFGQLGAPTGSLDPPGRPPAQERQVGSHMPVAAGNSEPVPGKKLHIHVPLGRPSSSPSVPGPLPPPGAAPPPSGAMPPPPGAAPPLPPPHSMPPMGPPPAFPPSPHPDSLQQQQPPPGYPTAFSAAPHPDSLHRPHPPPSYPAYPPHPHYPGYQPFPPQAPYWHHPPPPAPGGSTNQFPPPAPPPEVRTPIESKPPPSAADDIPTGKIVCDGGELLENEGRLVFDGGKIVTGSSKSQKQTQPSDLDDIPDGPIICDGGNMWIGERLKYEESQPKMQSDAADASETRSLQKALTESLKNLGSDLVMGNSSMLDDYDEGYQSDEPLDVVVDPNGSKPIDPRSANTPKPTDPRGAGQKRKRDEPQTLIPEIDQDEI